MTEAIKLHDVVALLEDLPAERLRRGDVGTVVHLFEQTPAHPGGFIVEFVDEAGQVRAQADILEARQIIKLHFNLAREAA